MTDEERKAYNEYHAAYHRKRYTDRMELAVATLGGRCVRCGSEEKLHIDHIDPEGKIMELSNMTRLSMEKFLKELEKCQILCHPHHNEKHHKGEITHGTESGYSYWRCRCFDCRKAARDARRERRGRVAQSGIERSPDKREGAGSNPASSMNSTPW